MTTRETILIGPPHSNGKVWIIRADAMGIRKNLLNNIVIMVSFLHFLCVADFKLFKIPVTFCYTERKNMSELSFL